MRLLVAKLATLCFRTAKGIGRIGEALLARAENTRPFPPLGRLAGVAVGLWVMQGDTWEVAVGLCTALAFAVTLPMPASPEGGDDAG